MPLQRVVERDALADQPLAVIDQQPQIQLGTFQLRGRQRIQAFAQRRPGDRDRVDAVGLPAPASAPTRVGHQPRRDAQNPLAAADQKPLKGPRDVPAVLDRPDPLALQAARPDEQRGEALGADLDRLLTHQLARRRQRPRRSCASACGCPHRARSLTSSTSTSMSGPTGGHGLLGALPRSYEVTPDDPRPTASDTAKGGQAPTGRQPERESARRRSRSLHLTSDVADEARSKQQA